MSFKYSFIIVLSLLISLAGCQPQENGPAPVGSDSSSGGSGDGSAPAFIQTLKNLNFETQSAGFPSGWEYSENVQHKGAVTLEAAQKKGGQSSLKMSPNAKNDNAQPLAIRQIIDVNALKGKTVTIRGHINNQGASGILAILSLVNGKPKNMQMLNSHGGGWQEVAVDYSIPGRGDVRLALICMVNGTTGSSLFDEIKFETPESQSPASEETSGQGGALKATATIDVNRVIRRVPRELFGTNVEWRWHGNFLWQEKQDRLDPDMVRMTRDMGVSLVRYPGGMYSDFFHWRDAIGDRRKRKKVLHEKGKPDESVPYLGPDEAQDFARQIGGELMITVNAGTGTAKEAADWVRYMNKDGLKVKYWEVGNELYLDDGSQFTSLVHTTPEKYAEIYLEFEKAMRAADPRIQIGAIGGLNQERYAVMKDPDWNEKVLRRIGDKIDYLSVHNGYAPVMATQRKPKIEDVYQAMFAYPAQFKKNLEDLNQQMLKYSKGKKPYLAVTEWGPFFHVLFDNPYIDHCKTLGSAVYVASAFKTMLESPETRIANFWLLNDLSVLGWIANSNDRFPADPEWRETARYYAFQMYARHLKQDIIQSSVQSPTFNSKDIGFMAAGRNVPYLDVVASKGEGKLAIFVINKHLSQSMKVDLKLNGVNGNYKVVSARCMRGSGLDAHTGTKIIKVPGMKIARQYESRDKRMYKGGLAEVEVIDFTPESLNPLTCQVPPLSVSVVELTVEGLK